MNAGKLPARRRFLRFALALGALNAVAGCGRAPPAPLRIGSNVWPGYEPLYLARDLGLFGQDFVQLVEYGSASQVLRAIEFSAIDAAALTLDEALLLQSNGVDARVVMVMDYSNGGDALIARPGIDGLAALKGRRVGAESTALGAYMLARALEHGGLAPGDVDLVPIELSEHETAFNAGVIDALVTFDPTRARLLTGGAKVLFDSTRIPGEIIDVLVVRAEFAATHLRQMTHLLSAWFAALDYLETQPVEAARIMDGRLRLGNDGVREALARIAFIDAPGNRKALVTEPAAFLETAERLAEVMVRHGLSSKRPVPDRLLDPRLLAGLYP